MGSIAIPKFVGFDLTKQNKRFLPFLFELIENSGYTLATGDQGVSWVSWFLKKRYTNILNYDALNNIHLEKFASRLAKIEQVAAPLLSKYNIDEELLKPFLIEFVIGNDGNTVDKDDVDSAPQNQKLYYLYSTPNKVSNLPGNMAKGTDAYWYLPNLFSKIAREDVPESGVVDWLGRQFVEIAEEAGSSLYDEVQAGTALPPNTKQVATSEGGVDRTYPQTLIFAGPPGTGKTREAKRFASKVIGIPLERWSTDEKAKFDDQVTIVQFHPTMSYEDFVEGLRPVVFQDGSIKYEIVLGPLRLAMVKSDSRRFLNIGVFAQNKTIVPVEQTWAMYGLPKHFTDLEFESNVHGFNALSFTLDGSVPRYTSIRVRSKLWSTDGMPKKYVLLIDEINRAKVSQVFGELLFAIADRDDKEMPVTVRTQYSREMISWNDNLTLVGTLNYTDRSVEDLDQALKRRFEFKHLNPDYKLLKADEFFATNFGVQHSEWLQDLNESLSKEKRSADFQIGHSYFLKMKNATTYSHKPFDELCLTLFREILPTLEGIVHRDASAMLRLLGRDVFQQIYGPYSGDEPEFLPGLKDEICHVLDRIEAKERPGNSEWAYVLECLALWKLVADKTLKQLKTA